MTFKDNHSIIHSFLYPSYSISSLLFPLFPPSFSLFPFSLLLLPLLILLSSFHLTTISSRPFPVVSLEWVAGSTPQVSSSSRCCIPEVFPLIRAAAYYVHPHIQHKHKDGRTTDVPRVFSFEAEGDCRCCGVNLKMSVKDKEAVCDERRDAAFVKLGFSYVHELEQVAA